MDKEDIIDWLRKRAGNANPDQVKMAERLTEFMQNDLATLIIKLRLMREYNKSFGEIGIISVLTILLHDSCKDTDMMLATLEKVRCRIIEVETSFNKGGDTNGSS
jgi:hypothetical protein